MDLNGEILELGRRARAAARILVGHTTAEKNAALQAMADAIKADTLVILAANAEDVADARAANLSPALIDRLTLTEVRISTMADAIRQAAALPDPVGQILREWTRPNGIAISKIRVPLGVVAMIYESRPNVTSDAAALCLKAGNAVILRGGSESARSNRAIADTLGAGCVAAGLPRDCILMVPAGDREAVRLLAEMDRYVDVIIPRGSHALIEAVVQHARMPVIKHSHGVCAIYVDAEADLTMAESILRNAKTQRPGVCNAVETLLLHRRIAGEFLKRLESFGRDCALELRADEQAFAQLSTAGYPKLKAATETDWTTEYLDLILAVRVVDDLAAAMAHIERHGSQHSDCVVTSNKTTAETFLRAVDSAVVYWNASTRFTDGSEFGFGAEIGISTGRVGARGPMGLEELTTHKYVIRGQGQVRK